MKMLLYRNFTGLKRDPLVFKAKIGQTVFINLLCLALFWDLKGNSFNEQMGLAGFLFFNSIFTLMNNMMGCILTF
jgi:hypothetical protein